MREEQVSYVEALKKLSHREIQVLELTGEGYTCKEVAKELSLSPATIKRHRENIRNKLKLHGHHSLIKWYIASNNGADYGT